MVERVEGFATKRQWRRGYEEINQFERLLVEDGIRMNSPIPGTVKNHDLTVLRKFLPESLEVMFPSLMRRWCRNGVHLETTRIQNPSKASNDAAFSSRIPPFEHDNSVLLRAEIGLLDGLEN